MLITASVSSGSGGTSYSFTDDPLVVNGTTVRAVHVTELRAAVDQASERVNELNSMVGKNPAFLNKYRTHLVVILLLAGMLLAVLTGIEIYRFFNPYLDREVTQAVTLSPNWQEVVPKKPLRLERKDQYIVLEMAEQLSTPNPSSEPTKDGSIVTFEVQLIDQDGNVYDLDEPAGDGRTEVWRGMSIKERSRLKDDIRFQSVRLRSNKTIRCSRILWRAYDPRDFK